MTHLVSPEVAKERPIIFTGESVRAILEGRKTQTRRLVKPQPAYVDEIAGTPDCSAYQVAEIGNSTGLAQAMCPYGQPGDRLWVRETWQYYDWTEDGYPTIRYAADNGTKASIDYPEEWSDRVTAIWETLSGDDNYNIDGRARDRKWRSVRFMPRWASRITLEVTDVRVQRLQEISDEDVTAEGIEPFNGGPIRMADYFNDRSIDHGRFRELWDSINAKRAPWASNPWVWCLTFRRIKP